MIYKAPLMLLVSLIAVFPFFNSQIPVSHAQTIVDEWEKVKAPKPVELKTVKIKPEETAFLILDIQKRSCNSKRRPRCVSTVPAIQKFLNKAKSKGVTVVYSLTSRGKPEDILSEVAPTGNEPVVKSSVDKFYKTNLEKILRDKGIKTVIIAGTSAEGAVIHTATGASMRRFKVIVPVDGMSSGTLYAEQYTAWHLTKAPGTKRRTTLTSFDKIDF